VNTGAHDYDIANSLSEIAYELKRFNDREELPPQRVINGHNIEAFEQKGYL
jgi:hypothetical protein